MFTAGLFRPGRSGEGLDMGPKLSVSSGPEGPGTKKYMELACPKVPELEMHGPS